jgi:hypothetical protein
MRTGVVTGFEVLNRNHQSACRYCGNVYHQHHDGDCCGGRGETNCPKCGAPSRVPLNAAFPGTVKDAVTDPYLLVLYKWRARLEGIQGRERPIELMVGQADGPKLTAYGQEYGKPELVHSHSRLPFRKGEEVLLGTTGLPCNGDIIEPWTSYDVTFSAWSRARVEDGVLVLDATDPSVKVAWRSGP